jgi:hypothetical protein
MLYRFVVVSLFRHFPRQESSIAHLLRRISHRAALSGVAWTVPNFLSILKGFRYYAEKEIWVLLGVRSFQYGTNHCSVLHLAGTQVQPRSLRKGSVTYYGKARIRRHENRIAGSSVFDFSQTDLEVFDKRALCSTFSAWKNNVQKRSSIAERQILN